jgi:MFS family permease
MRTPLTHPQNAAAQRGMRRVLGPYDRVLTIRGAWRFSLSAFVARMPMSMVTLGLVLLIQAETGSYGLAGAVSAAYMLASAVTGPLLGRATDRYGQAPILLPCTAAFLAGLLATVGAVEAGWGTPVPHLFAAIAGAGFPPIGACVRARWSALLGDDKAALHTAYSLESVIDEAVFMTGPVVVTLLATLVHELAGIAAIVVFASVGGLWFAAQRSSEPPIAAREFGTGGARLGWSWLGPVVAVAACLGSLFGSTEVATVAFTKAHGHASLSGVLLAIWAFGSMLAGVVTGSAKVTSGPARRFVLGAAGMGAVMIPLPFVHALWLMPALLFVAGFAISPTLIAVAGIVDAWSAPERLTEAMVWFNSGLTIGLAPGAAIAGRLIDLHGPSAGYAVAAASGLGAAFIAAASSPLMRPRLA